MRRIVIDRILLVIVFSIIACAFLGAFRPVQAMAAPRAGLLSFGGNAEREYCKLAAGKLVSLLAQDFTFFALVDPGEIERILEEEGFSATGLVEETEAVAVARRLNLDIVFIGHIDQLSYKYPWAEARLTVRGIAVESGELLYVIEGYGTASDADGETAMRQAVADCFSGHFLAELRRKVVPYSVVSAVEGDFLYFRNGREIGITAGMQYRILRPRALKEEVVYKEEIGTAEVTDVTGSISKAKIIRAAEKVREGDYLEEIPPAPKKPPVAAGKREPGLHPAGKKPERAPAPARSRRKGEVTAFSFTPVFLDDDTPFNLVEIRPRLEGSCFYSGTCFGLGLGKTEDIYIKTGVEAGIQLPAAPRFFALTFGGAAGYAFLHRGPHDEFFRSKSLTSGFYWSGSAGIRFFPFGRDRLRLEYESLTHKGPGKFKIKGQRITVVVPF